MTCLINIMQVGICDPLWLAIKTGMVACMQQSISATRLASPSRKHFFKAACLPWRSHYLLPRGCQLYFQRVHRPTEKLPLCEWVTNSFDESITFQWFLTTIAVWNHWYISLQRRLPFHDLPNGSRMGGKPHLQFWKVTYLIKNLLWLHILCFWILQGLWPQNGFECKALWGLISVETMENGATLESRNPYPLFFQALLDML